MTQATRENWSRHVDQILRSKHYTWIGEGLGGAPAQDAMVAITADLMHMCHRMGVSWDDLVHRSQQLCDCEESEIRPTSHAA